MSALEQLREGLREAARRDVSRHRIRRRRHRRATGVVALALLGGAAAAGATDLISVGEPIRDPVGRTAAYRAADGRSVEIAVQAHAGGELPFAVGIYEAANGHECALAGSVRGTALGEIQAGRFRPYGRSRTGACRTAGRPLYDLVRQGDRMILYGRAPRAAREVRVTQTGDTARPALGGAFLSVFEDVPRTTRLTVEFVE